MRTLPHENVMSELLAPDSERFNLFLEYLIACKNETRDNMPLATAGFEKLQHQWALLEELTKDEGSELRLRIRKFWFDNAPKSSKGPFAE